MIGGGGEKRTLRLVARYADQCDVTGDVDTLTHKIDVLRGHCADVGRDPAEVEVTWMTVAILTNSAENTAGRTGHVEAGGSPEEDAGFTVGQPARDSRPGGRPYRRRRRRGHLQLALCRRPRGSPLWAGPCALPVS